jgi:phospholipid/cholesterol/gamma-HCH transport system substrate-binding protein
MEGLSADYQLLIDVRDFKISLAADTPQAHVAFAAKILGEGGKIVGSRAFDAIVPAPKTDAAGATAALSAAFGKAVVELVLWTQHVI